MYKFNLFMYDTFPVFENCNLKIFTFFYFFSTDTQCKFALTMSAPQPKASTEKKENKPEKSVFLLHSSSFLFFVDIIKTLI